MIKNTLDILNKSIREHWLALVVALFLGLIIMSPHIVSTLQAGKGDFRGIYASFSDDEVYYQARIKEVMDGHLAIGNPYIKEHEGGPFIHPPVAEWFIAFVAKVFCLSAPLVTVYGDFIFPFIGFMLLYFFLWRIVGSKPISIFFALLFFVLFLQTFGRPISPQFNFIFLIAGLFIASEIYLGGAMSPKKRVILNLLLGLVTGITLFISPYYWTSVALFYFVLIFSQVFMEKGINAIKKNIPWFLVSFGPFVLVYGIFYVRSASLVAYAESAERFGLIRSHMPGSFSNIALGVLAGFVLFLLRKRLSAQKLFFTASLVLSIFILNWQNVITGQYLQFSSHYLLVTVLYVLVALAIISDEIILLLKSKTFSRAFVVAIVALVFLALIFLVFKQKGEVKRFFFFFEVDKTVLLEEQQRADVFDWFNKNTLPGSVVYALGNNYDFLIPAYTKNKVYYNFYANLYLMPNQETEERWLVQNIFNEGINESYIAEHQRDFWGNRFIDSYQFKENRRKIMSFLMGNDHTPLEQLNPDIVANMEKRFLMLKDRDFYELIKTFQADYILLSSGYPHYEGVVNALKLSPKIHQILDINGNKIYKIE